ncbi:protein COFACTOR ASSEMBLY OF COMPLEX C SUBUNIT B CCB3, chloroplastic-like [Actinidia eriantha]|uniref:protein COFACTOR ASSEMBLY OF COMPLEX C SUBUNIT B CCB3, chloroplastic-like n=1 Tax=Actinidia eriantha TaxID=165200 RepID=UPI0025842E07|nr:protein COFACTOR ASSEMBLY OF COMPLEX C SUBUNIT B CCB3, chloroplastic-like [Actinidia eriantha]
MEKSGLLISSRNINPIPCMSISDFHIRNLPPSRLQFSLDKIKCPIRRRPNRPTCCSMENTVSQSLVCEPSHTDRFAQFLVPATTNTSTEFMQSLVLLDLDPATAKLAISFLGPFLSAFGFLFIVRIVMSWYPKLPVEKFPYVVAYAPTEPLLVPTRKLIPPLGGVDVTPVVWFGLISFMNEILVGPQGLLVLLSQQV